MHVLILAGKVIALVMMKTTIVDVTGMGETVVEVMLTQIIAQLANVLNQMKNHQNVNMLTILVITIVTMEIIKKFVNGMEETVVVMMLTQNIV